LKTKGPRLIQRRDFIHYACGVIPGLGVLSGIALTKVQNPTLTSLSMSQVVPGAIHIYLYGSGFKAGASVVVGYIFGAVGRVDHIVGQVPASVDNSSQIRVSLQLNDPGEFQLTVHNPDGGVSNPLILFVGLDGYKLPYPAHNKVYCSQGNNGAFDHNWSTLKGIMTYAYDFVDTTSATSNSTAQVVAMKGGSIVNSNDAHKVQTPTYDWGNYITIQHGSNEYSHYAHLKTGTFKVTKNQYVTQGTPLATVGNSGYTLPKGGGYHVHVEVTRTNNINAQSIPFLFDDVYSPSGSLPGQPVSGGSYTA